jgi:hypothetical protein
MQQLSVAPGKFAKLCSVLAKGQSMQWSYEAASSRDFNIHYLQGKEMVYPARASASRSEGHAGRRCGAGVLLDVDQQAGRCGRLARPPPETLARRQH